MTAAFFLASIVVGFIAGIVALAMPCCFSVLLPAYVAKSFDRARGRLMMTGVFATGIGAVLLPIAMGATALTAFLGVNHPLLFVLGGAFMIVLGLLTLWGMDLIPQLRFNAHLERKDVPSVFALGVFSGVASSCCAPVLIGVIVLTSISGSLFQAGVIGLAYVLGMVFPLLVAATLWDRRGQRLGLALRGRLLLIRLGSKEWTIHSSKFIAGVLFVAMGVATVALGVLDRMLPIPGSQLIGIYQTQLEQGLTQAFSTPMALVLILVAIAVPAALLLLRRRPSLGGGLRRAVHPSTPTSEEDTREVDSLTRVKGNEDAAPEPGQPDLLATGT